MTFKIIKNKHMKKINKIIKAAVMLILFGILLNTNFAKAQESSEGNSSFLIKSDFMSHYVWRGSQFGAMSVQPTIEYAPGSFGIGSWGSTSFSDNTNLQEVDLYMYYTISDIVTVLLTDYFVAENFANDNYFNFSSEDTKHILEASVIFEGTEKIPFSLLLATNFYGNDVVKADESLNYSTYTELTYNKTFKAVGFSAFLGASLNTPGNDLPSIYGNTKPAIVNLGIKIEKKIKITNSFSLPLSVSYIANPDAGKTWVVLGVSLSVDQ